MCCWSQSSSALAVKPAGNLGKYRPGRPPWPGTDASSTLLHPTQWGGGGTRGAPPPHSKVEGLSTASPCLPMWVLSIRRFKWTWIKLDKPLCGVARLGQHITEPGCTGSSVDPNISCVSPNLIIVVEEQNLYSAQAGSIKLVCVALHRHTLRGEAPIICSAQQFGYL